MSGSGKESLIMQLYNATFGGVNNTSSDSRYSADTNTLYSEGKHAKTTTDAPMVETAIDTVCEKKEFEEILCGRAHFVIIDEKEAMLGKEVRIREIDGLVPTGRYVIKTITQVARSKDNSRVKEPYAVVGWE